MGQEQLSRIRRAHAVLRKITGRQTWLMSAVTDDHPAVDGILLEQQWKAACESEPAKA